MTTVSDSPVYLNFTINRFSTFTPVGSFPWPATRKACCYNSKVYCSIIKSPFSQTFNLYRRKDTLGCKKYKSNHEYPGTVNQSFDLL